MPADHVNVVLVHGAWADGSSWGKVIGPLKAAGRKVIAAPLPLTSLADDIAAVGRALERLDGPVVLAGHAYAGAVIAGRAQGIKLILDLPAVGHRVHRVAALRQDQRRRLAECCTGRAADPPAERGRGWHKDCAL